jgi:hypothetical protein
MVSLAEILVSNNNKKTFTFDGEYIDPLFLVARSCRNPALRRKAISLCKNVPKMEWGWDSCLVGQVSEVLMRMEEDFIHDGFVPEHARLCGVQIHFDYMAATAIVRCCQKTVDGEDVLREEDLALLSSR